LSDSDKKAKKKAKKAAQKTQDENKKCACLVQKPCYRQLYLIALPAATSANKDDDLSEPPKDDDPDGQKLLTTANPLSDAMKWLKPLETLTKDRVDVWVAIYDVTTRQSMFTAPSTY
jgi:N-alpha-acetyltransferase 15/16, NatA auxiliary subunit